MDYKYNGIILAKKDVGETDRIYTIYTREAGKISARAVGVKKPNAKLAGFLEPVTTAEIFIARTKGTGKITASIPVNNFAGIKKDLASLNQAFSAFKIFNKIIADQEEDEAVFNLLADYLESLEKMSRQTDKNYKKEILKLGFLFKLLDRLGYKIEVGRCVICETKLAPEGNFYSASLGGVLCSNCQSKESRKIRVSPEVIKLIRIFLKNGIKSLVKLKVSEKDIQNLKQAVREALLWVSG